ncbi:MAG: nickel pincer cofactor biosynthesis protein LarB [Proteobacteria bacterium]|nr:nickel pincer cofactor biosynthesis protein LarB [Pseudomonadota bacterium]MDA1356016.1 nickel pincer cofactor biosynthesis protein LarB [Pseudomonadota bacterium]
MVERDIKLDVERRERLGFDEAILCAGKSDEHLTAILEQAGDDSLLLTRLDAAALKSLPPALAARIDYEPLSRTGIFGSVAAPTGKLETAIVTAGTSDVRVSREAARTLAYYGTPCLEINDVGVAGLWRLMERIDEIKRHRIVIAVAGLDAALPSVIGGLVPGLVIAVPTSTGYGVARGGETALFSSLVSCAPGVVVVNIDNGYGAACAALRALCGGG